MHPNGSSLSLSHHPEPEGRCARRGRHHAALLGLFTLLQTCAAGSSDPRTDPSTLSLTSADLDVQAGQIEALPASGLRLRSAMTRAVLARRDAVALELSFVYRGPTRELAPLASGELRRQIGLKLRAQDTCNVVYAMWHIAPSQGLHVAVKTNPGQSTHAQCHDAGYVTLAPDFAAPGLAPIVEGQRRRMAAEIRGDRLDLWIDGTLAWSARLPREALQLQGPFGLRSDNAAFDVELRVHQTSLGPTPPEAAD